MRDPSSNPRSNWEFQVKNHGPLLFDIYLFANIAGWVAWQTAKSIQAGRFGFIEGAFTLQNVVFTVLILVRKRHQAVEKNLWRQLVSLIAFYSGFALLGQPLVGGPGVVMVSRAIILTANGLGLLCLLNLGRSFGILIAFRELKTRGLYAIVRHPMYGTDLLLRVGYVVGHCTAWTVSVFIFSSACYLYRALLEEQFLSKQTDYRAYQMKVPYRFIPGVF